MIRVLALLLLLSACQSNPHNLPFPERLQSWQGAGFNDLVQAWGLPARKSFDNSTGFAEWYNNQRSRGPTISIGLGTFGSRVSTSIRGTIPGTAKTEQCTIQVQFDAQKIAVKLSSKGPEDLCESLVPTRYH